MKFIAEKEREREIIGDKIKIFELCIIDDKEG